MATEEQLRKEVYEANERFVRIDLVRTRIRRTCCCVTVLGWSVSGDAIRECGLRRGSPLSMSRCRSNVCVRVSSCGPTVRGYRSTR